MTKQRLHIAIVLMLMAILAVVLFQSYWLYKNYRDEEKTIGIRANFLFRDALMQCQAEKIKLDSNFNIKLEMKNEALGMINVLRDKVLFRADSLTRFHKTDKTVMISVDSRAVHRPDSSNIQQGDSIKTIRYFTNPNEVGWIQVLKRVDSLQDSITIKELTERYAKLLDQEKIKIPFSISRAEGRRTEPMMPVLDKANEVTVGFSKPLTFKLHVENLVAIILRRISSQILVSVLLVGITVLSFLILLRNLIRQRRLTQLKNEFISNVTHELKTPIATVSVAIEALKNFNAMQDPEKTKEYLEISGNELQRLSLLVDKVLKLSMFENRQMEFKKERFDLRQLVEETINTMKLQFERANATVTFDCDKVPLMIEADRLHITSVLYNLLDNALKYGSENPKVKIELARSSSDIISINVCDNGIGIPNEYKDRVFDKFFRVPMGDQHNIKGYGLGLSYVSEVVKGHMGYITIDSEPGKGSCFHIKLPVQEKEVVDFGEGRIIRKETVPMMFRNIFGPKKKGGKLAN